MTWNERCLASISDEKRQIELKYGIRIGKTEIFCSKCGKKWDYMGNNGCKGSLAHLTIPLENNNLKKPFKRTTEHMKGIV